MGIQAQGEVNSYVAAAALTKFRFVKETTTGREATCNVAAAAAKPIGIVTEDVASGGDAPVIESGIFALEVNGQSVNIAVGDPIKPTTGGVGVKAATEGDYFGAVAKEAASTDGAIIKVSVERGYLATA